jgi:hypothetical protein
VLDPSTSIVTVPATTTIGSTTQPVAVEDRGAVLECTGTTSGADCIDIAQWGALVCTNKGPITYSNGGCSVTSSTSFVGTSLVSNADKTGAQSDFTLTGMDISPNTSATVSEGSLWMVAVEGKGIVRDSSVGCVTSSYGLLLQDGPATGDNNALVFQNDQFFGSGNACLAPVAIMSTVSGTGAGANILFVGGSSVDSSTASTGCPSGKGCLIDIDGTSGGANNSGLIDNITFDDFYLESYRSGGSGSSPMNFIELKNARGVEFNNMQFNGGPTLNECLVISESATNYVGYVHLTGRIRGSRCSGVENTITSTSVGGQDLNYTYAGDESASGAVFDGGLSVGPRAFAKYPACGAATQGMFAAITDSTTATWGATIAGGGANHVLGYCDNPNWTVAAK